MDQLSKPFWVIHRYSLQVHQTNPTTYLLVLQSTGGDGSISTAELDGSSEELSVLSTVEFYTNEMISDIRFYGEGANNYIELSIYLNLWERWSNY